MVSVSVSDDTCQSVQSPSFLDIAKRIGCASAFTSGKATDSSMAPQVWINTPPTGVVVVVVVVVVAGVVVVLLVVVVVVVVGSDVS